MLCSCIKGNYDFSLESITNKALIYQDFSTWMTDEGYEIPAVYDVSITTPSKNEVTVSVFTDKKNRILSTSLGLSEDTCLLDGIYCFTVINCGTTYSRSKAYLPNLECCVQDLIAKAKTDEDFAIAEQLEFYVQSVHVNSELNKTQKAQDFFDLAQRKLQNLNCNCF